MMKRRQRLLGAGRASMVTAGPETRMEKVTPTVSRVYQNHHLDSTRWRHYRPVRGDVIVTTAYKAGTTWTQLIVMSLLQPECDEMPNVHVESIWPDRRFGQTDDEVAQRLAARDPARPQCLKSHLPLDGLPYHRDARYIVVGRDPRDVFMSLFNHYTNYTPALLERLNGDGRVGAALPPCPCDPRTLWRDWITRGWFDWEHEGWPFWGNLAHTASYWAFRQLPNLLLVHYRDLSSEPHAQIARVASFIGSDAAEDQIEEIVKRTRFDRVKRDASRVMPHLDESFKGGADAFFHKGGGGRWRDVLTPEDLDLYEQTKRRLVSPECAAWLERGTTLAA